jgi:hypothetical protein
MFVSSARRQRRAANLRIGILAALTIGLASCVLTPPPALEAQTPAVAAPCPASSILLAAKPIKGVGSTTIRNACPAFLAALTSWYASHPAATIADAVAAIAGTPIIVAPTPTPPPVVVPAPAQRADPSLGSIAYDDFSTYTNTADLLKRFWVGPGHDMGAQPFGVTYDTLEHAMRYDWPARATASCTSELTVGAMPRLNPPPSTKDLWIRFTSKESAQFEHGRSGCGGRSYKFFLVTFETAGQLKGRVGTYLGDASSSSMFPTNLWMDVVGRMPGDTIIGPTPSSIGGVPSWGGDYHTWVVGLEHISSDSATFSVYLDGSLVKSLRAPFLSGATIGAGWAVMLELGANINNGPDHSQSRWFRELGVYASKPSLSPLVSR